MLLFILYVRRARKRWENILGRALDYHHFHLRRLRDGHGIGRGPGETALRILWLLKNFHREEKGLRGIMNSFGGKPTTLQTISMMLTDMHTARRISGEEIDRLLLTLFSTVLRINLLNSCLRPLFLVCWDTGLLLSAAVKRKGAAALYRDMYREE